MALALWPDSWLLEKSLPCLQAALSCLPDKIVVVPQAVYREFDRLRRGRLPGTCLVAQLPGNERRNRYTNVLPFDENRVRLRSPGHDYINASSLASPASEAPAWRYIATQARPCALGTFFVVAPLFLCFSSVSLPKSCLFQYS